MALQHCRVWMGKFLDDITTLIDPQHYIIDEFSPIGHAIEPGEPNLPTADEMTIVLANLSPTGVQRYPYTFWRDNSRTPEEGGTLPIEIFFRVEILGKTEFLGVYDSVSYGTRDEKLSLTIKDLAGLLKDDKRRMLRTFELPELEVISADPADTGNNLLPQAVDHAGTPIEHEALTFTLFDRTAASPGVNRVSRPRGMDVNHAFIRHLGIRLDDPAFDLDTYDVTRNVFVQIGETTLFTRVRFWGLAGVVGTTSFSRLHMTVYHWKNPVGSTIPRGRFFKSDQLDAIAEGDLLKMKIHDYRIPPASQIAQQGDGDVIISDVDIPAYENYLGGCSYSEQGGQVQLTTARYSYFDVIKRTLEIFENYIGTRFTNGAIKGSIEVLTDAEEASGAGSQASYTITAIQPAQLAYEYRIVADNEYWESDLVSIDQYESILGQEVKIRNAINAGKSKVNWTAALNPGGGVLVTSKAETSKFNGFVPFVWPLHWSTEVNATIITGGVDGDISGGVRIQIGDDIDVTTADIIPGEDRLSIAQKIKDALDADPAFTGTYTATLNGAIVDISGGGEKLAINVDAQLTRLEFDIRNLITSYALFDTSRLISRNRHAFFADPIFFGWVDKKLSEILVGAAWQTTAYLFTTAEGKLALHSRDWFETLPDLYQPGYPATLLADQYLEPISGVERENGFSSYSIEHPVDVVEINNVASDETKKIYVDANVKQVVEVIDRSGTEHLTWETLDGPSANNKELKTSNFRIYDLGVPSQNEVAEDIPVLRLSPTDPAWPHSHTLDDFLPTPLIQAIRFAKSFQWPVETINDEFFRLRYPDLAIGDYVVLENLNLYLVKQMSIQPGSLVTSVEMEFKKGLTETSITWDSDQETFDSTLLTFDHT